jgi:hypothetical protein
VFCPVPFPPVSHVDVDGATREVAVPTGAEEWFPATVTAVERHARSVEPDGYVAVLKTDDGSTLAMSVTFLRADRP